MNELSLFELKTDISIGNITTNAALLLEAVKRGVEKYYDPAYVPTEQAAKDDRAGLNRAEKLVAEKAKEIKDLWNAPLESFNQSVAEIRSTIKEASGTVDSAVKTYEEKRKATKRTNIELYWESKKFDLVSLDRIFDERWLNKGTEIRDIKEQIDNRIDEIHQDIEVLERIADYGQTAKALYLETLDMGAALRQVDILKENAGKLAREQANREERKITEQVEQNATEESREAWAAVKEEKVQSLIDEALELPAGTTETEARQELFEVTLRIKSTKERMLGLRKYMTANEISYVKVGRQYECKV